MTWLEEVEDFHDILERLKKIEPCIDPDLAHNTIVEAICALGNAIENLERRAHNHPRRTKNEIKLDAFDNFWTAYPRKVGKGAARKAWKKLNPSGGLQAVMLNAIATQKQSPDWKREGGQFIPHPATWLNQERWADSVEVDKPEKNPQANMDPRNQWRDPETGKIWNRIDVEDIAVREPVRSKQLLDRARKDRLEWDWSL